MSPNGKSSNEIREVIGGVLLGRLGAHGDDLNEWLPVADALLAAMQSIGVATVAAVDLRTILNDWDHLAATPLSVEADGVMEREDFEAVFHAYTALFDVVSDA